jgi:two-component system response regulator MprA
VVEDDAQLAGAVALDLAHAGYDVRVEPDGPAALLAGPEWGPDVIVLDLGLPSLDGLEVCRRLRIRGDVPIVVVTARGSVEDRVRGLDAGADDYVVKPFSLDELQARVRSVLRRSRLRREGSRLQAADVVLDATARTVTCAARPLALTRREFDLLEYFLRHAGQALTRAQLLLEVWGYDFDGGSNVVDVYVRYLRCKLQDAGAPPLIETVRGVGYALREPECDH